MVLPIDSRIVYTDMLHVMINNYGVVMNFMQSSGVSNQPMAVARVGMSLEHARSVVEILQKTIDQATAPVVSKALPAPKKASSQEADQ